MDKGQYQDILSLIQQNPSICGFDLYYLGFLSYYAPQLTLQGIFTHIRNIIDLYQDKLINDKEKIEFLIRILSKKINPDLYKTLLPNHCANPDDQLAQNALNEYFGQILKLVCKHASISNFELFYLGKFHAICPAYPIAGLFKHISNIHSMVKNDLIDEEIQVNFLIKILNSKIQQNQLKSQNPGLNIPKDSDIKTQFEGDSAGLQRSLSGESQGECEGNGGLKQLEQSIKGLTILVESQNEQENKETPKEKELEILETPKKPLDKNLLQEGNSSINLLNNQLTGGSECFMGLSDRLNSQKEQNIKTPQKNNNKPNRGFLMYGQRRHKEILQERAKQSQKSTNLTEEKYVSGPGSVYEISDNSNSTSIGSKGMGPGKGNNETTPVFTAVGGMGGFLSVAGEDSEASRRTLFRENSKDSGFFEMEKPKKRQENVKKGIEIISFESIINRVKAEKPSSTLIGKRRLKIRVGGPDERLLPVEDGGIESQESNLSDKPLLIQLKKRKTLEYLQDDEEPEIDYSDDEYPYEVDPENFKRLKSF